LAPLTASVPSPKSQSISDTGPSDAVPADASNPPTETPEVPDAGKVAAATGGECTTVTVLVAWSLAPASLVAFRVTV
jgi:hypothetical protein